MSDYGVYIVYRSWIHKRDGSRKLSGLKRMTFATYDEFEEYRDDHNLVILGISY